MTRAHVTACVLALTLTAGSPFSDAMSDGGRLPVPDHVIADACSNLRQERDVAECIRSENIDHKYVADNLGRPTDEERKEIDTLASRNKLRQTRFNREMARYVEDKIRAKLHLD